MGSLVNFVFDATGAKIVPSRQAARYPEQNRLFFFFFFYLLPLLLITSHYICLVGQTDFYCS